MLSGGTVTNTGTILGGNGGMGGRNNSGSAGLGGAGITGANLTVINSGTIAGGLSGDTVPVQGSAIVFTGGTNVLEIKLDCDHRYRHGVQRR